ncbi:hypothetical protein CYY_003921 [Polysphondylium violaceum]|uniref:Guanosine-3',5'-bis(diphosphate) 3'-pyrophosphohydrolase MESH1 n=1 Tax=Polysphondylium violaceum TaxID=133409 RepID=A0A8J4UZS0_9MYCE|nr:hypothetical protein CYY_003921 [Polysphondylium violaceum]
MTSQENTDIATLMKTIEFASIKHRDQRRKDKHSTPYINHPIGVANQISQIGKVYDTVVLQAALLHDTVEDTNTTKDELVKEFGQKVADIVMDVTDDKSLPKVERKKHQVEHAAHISREAKLVKLSDKLYNLSDILGNAPPFWTVSVIQGYFVWGKAVVNQIRGTNKALEEKLDQVFASSFIYKDGATYRAIPCTPEEEPQFLESYYKEIAE